MTGYTFAVFDMDEVLYDFEHPVRLQLLEELTGQPQAEIHEAVWGGPHENLAEAGQPDTADGYLAQFADLLGYPIDFDTWADIRRRMMRPRKDVLDMVRRLSKQTDVALLTNNGMLLKKALPVCAPEVIEIFAEKSHVSADFKARKPEPDVFLRICAHYGHEPRQTLFVDDRDENIIGAEAAGLTAHLYRSPAELAAFLHKCGLNPG